jgi:hypothetical protein
MIVPLKSILKKAGKVAAAAALLSLPLLVAAQDYNQYKPLQSRWIIPADFTGRSSQKYYKDVASIDANESRFTRKSKKDFFLESNFGMGDFLTSGRVLFHDEASAYLSEIIDVLLKDDPELRKQIRIYVVKSTASNAFATNNGIVFVTMGLLARLENEAQLAWILSHEVVHFREQHVINSYVKGQEIKQSKGMYKRLSLDEQDYAKSSFSKEQETEADAKGMEIFLKSGWSKQAAVSALDVLGRSHLPLYDKPVSLSMFESKQFKLPAKLMLDSVKQPTKSMDYDDSKSSHPNLKKRKEAVQLIIGKKAANPFGETRQLVSASSFDNIRNRAAFEVLREHLITGEYVDAFYHAYLLTDQYPESEYVQTSMAKALYGLARWGAHAKTDDYEGEIQRIAHLAQKQQHTERLVLAIRYLYPMHIRYPENEELDLMLKDLIIELALKDKVVEKRFNRQQQAAAEMFINEEISYLKTAFSDFKDQAAFYTYFDEMIGRVRKAELEQKKRQKKKTKDPVVDKVVVVQPVYRKIDKRKKKSIRHEDSEDVLFSIDEKIEESAALLNMQVSIINTNTLNSKEIDAFNEHTMVQDWLREKLRHDSPDGISPVHAELQELMKKHDTNYLMWMGGMSLTQRNRGLLYYALLSLASPVFVPAALHTAFVPDKQTYFFAFTFDTREDNLLSSDVRLMKLKDNTALMQSNIYYTLFKLKNP